MAREETLNSFVFNFASTASQLQRRLVYDLVGLPPVWPPYIIKQVVCRTGDTSGVTCYHRLTSRLVYDLVSLPPVWPQ